MGGVKVASGNTVVRIDNTGGTLKDITSQVTEIEGLERVWDTEDITAFSDSETRQVKVFPAGVSVTVRGIYRSGSSDADVFYRALVEESGSSAVHTLEVLPDGTRMISGEFSVTTYRYLDTNKQVVRFEAVHMSDGAITLASSS